MNQDLVREAAVAYVMTVEEAVVDLLNITGVDYSDKTETFDRLQRDGWYIHRRPSSPGAEFVILYHNEEIHTVYYVFMDYDAMEVKRVEMSKEEIERMVNVNGSKES